jgi:hypothetical protein
MKTKMLMIAFVTLALVGCETEERTVDGHRVLSQAEIAKRWDSAPSSTTPHVRFKIGSRIEETSIPLEPKVVGEGQEVFRVGDNVAFFVQYWGFGEGVEAGLDIFDANTGERLDTLSRTQTRADGQVYTNIYNATFPDTYKNKFLIARLHVSGNTQDVRFQIRP